MLARSARETSRHDSAAERRLAGRTFLITGAAGGMGAAQARALAAQGADLVIGDLDADATAAVADTIGERVRACKLDVREEADWQAAIEKAVSAFGRPLDGMVNNAGIGGGAGTILDMPTGHYLDVVMTNQVGTFLGLARCGRHMAESGGGSIVVISSVLGLAGHRNLGPYVSSKFAIRGLTRVAALELAGAGVRVNCVCPGTVDTGMLRGGDDGVDALAGLAGQVPQGVVAGPDDVAHAVQFLLSDEARYITGTDLVVDGGMMAAIPLRLG